MDTNRLVPLDGQDVAVAPPPPPSTRVRILICDDREVFRVGLERVLRSAVDLEVVGHAVARTHVDERCRRLDPHLALVSLDLPDALEIVQSLTTYGVGVVALATGGGEDDLFGTLRAGARAYVTTAVVADRLIGTIRSAARGEVVLEPEAATLLMSRLAAPDRAAPAPPVPPPGSARLTNRQTTIAALVAEGLSNSDIAARLFVSQATVKTHITAILRRLNLRDRTQLAIALHRGGTADQP